MSTMTKLADRIAWSNIHSKMKGILLVAMTGVPLSLLVMGEKLSRGQMNNILVLWAVSGIILLIPLSKLCTYFLALRPIRELNALCLEMKSGNLDPFANLPAEPARDDALQRLRHNMFWMGHVIGNRQQALSKAKAELEAAQASMGESIEYAKRIQKAFLPQTNELDSLLPDHFLLWDQRDTVGGDSYWVKRTENGFFIAIIDCTGHGVPGAFMTLIVQSLFDQIDSQKHEGNPAAILEEMNKGIRMAFETGSKGSTPNDGMDCTLLFINANMTRLVFSGARNPLFIRQTDGTVTQLKGDRKGVGNDSVRRNTSFTNQEVELCPGMILYTLTDGLIDQPGGTKGFSFGKKRFAKFISGQTGSMQEQKQALQSELAQYQGQQSRRDDVMVLGFSIRRTE